MAADGLITIPSRNSVKATLDRLESEVKARGIAVFARIDHAAGATRAGLALRPTELLIFGNAIAGTPLMQAAQSIGIDLPAYRSAAPLAFVIAMNSSPPRRSARYGAVAAFCAMLTSSAAIAPVVATDDASSP